jgi:hypothetical protein
MSTNSDSGYVLLSDKNKTKEGAERDCKKPTKRGTKQCLLTISEDYDFQSKSSQ